MDCRKIDELVWRALIDQQFREGLLNGCRRELAAAFGLSQAEQVIVMGVQADSLEAFAAALC